jgi:hypothetical protein
MMSDDLSSRDLHPLEVHDPGSNCAVSGISTLFENRTRQVVVCLSGSTLPCKNALGARRTLIFVFQPAYFLPPEGPVLDLTGRFREVCGSGRPGTQRGQGRHADSRKAGRGYLQRVAGWTRRLTNGAHRARAWRGGVTNSVSSPTHSIDEGDRFPIRPGAAAWRGKRHDAVPS